MPIWNFNEIQRTGDLRYLIILDTYNELPIINNLFLNKLQSKWDALEIEYLDRVGVEEDYKRFVLDQKEVLISALECVIESDDFKDTLHEILENRFKDKYKKSEETVVTFEDNLAYLEGYYGFQIDLNNTSCIKYFTYLKAMKKRIEIENNHG